MKKQLPTHDDSPSKPLAPKVIETQEPNYEGKVRETNYSVKETERDTRTSIPQSKSVRSDYPLPDDEIDIYSVDDRIWARLDGMGGDGGPHTHNNYADKSLFEEHLANHPSGGDGGGYDDTALKGRVSQNETDISNLKVENNSQNQKIQANSTAIDGKASTTHTHPEHAPVVHGHNDLATKEELTQGLAGKANEPHTHPAPTGFWGMWKGTQAEFDALASKSDKTLYVVI